jgi:hypothetical protein
VPAPALTAGTRLWYAFVCWFRVLFDPEFAARAWQAREALPAAPERPSPTGEALPEPPAATGRAAPAAPAAPPEKPTLPDMRAALQLLSLLQREGRLIDFLEEDIASFKDADVGAAARVVHDGCRKALREHVSLEAVRSEQEGEPVTLQEGFDASTVKLTGNVRGAGPYRGALRHRGWRAREVQLPTLLDGADPNILTPAEVEL